MIPTLALALAALAPMAPAAAMAPAAPAAPMAPAAPVAPSAPAAPVAGSLAQEPVAAYDRITPEVRVVQSSRPSVVFVKTESPRAVRTFWGTVKQLNHSSGSGVVIHEDGYIVTNYHVVQGAENGKIEVSFDAAYDEAVYPADLISAVPEQDLALLKIREGGNFPPITVGTSSDLWIGERVIAIGSPYGHTHTVSVGIISGLHRNLDVQTESHALSFENLIQTDASINPGNSGGPLLNINGEMIGINAVMNREAENIGFAIPVDRVMQVLEEVLLAPSMARAWLGFGVDEESLRVTEVVPGGPAEEQGIRPGDRLVAIDDEVLSDTESYRLARVSILPGRDARLRFERNGREFPAEITSWARAEGLLYQRLGLQVEPLILSGRIGWRTTLRVARVRPESPAAELELQPGDVIDGLRPYGRRAAAPSSAEEFAVLVSNLAEGTRIDFDIWRDLDENGRYEERNRFGESEYFKGPLVLQ